MHEQHNTTKGQTHRSLEQKITFFFVCVGAISLTYGFLYLIDFLPEAPESQTTEEQSEVMGAQTNGEETQAIPGDAEALPTKIVFDTLGGKEVTVFNPTSSDVAVLDAALLNGAVRHPDSADFKNTGTMFILAHSSYLPQVFNKSYQAFNDIQKLKWGDTIRLYSDDTEYIYSVDRVYETKASGAEVAIQYEEAKLTLATCNSFATKDDRYIVEASLVSKKPLGGSKG